MDVAFIIYMMMFPSIFPLTLSPLSVARTVTVLVILHSSLLSQGQSFSWEQNESASFQHEVLNPSTREHMDDLVNYFSDGILHFKKRKFQNSRAKYRYRSLSGRKYSSEQHRVFPVKITGVEYDTQATDTAARYCTQFDPLFITEQVLRPSQQGNSTEKLIKIILRKRKERTETSKQIQNNCCIFSTVVSWELLIAWFVRDYRFVKLDGCYCKKSVLYIDQYIIDEIEKMVFGIKENMPNFLSTLLWKPMEELGPITYHIATGEESGNLTTNGNRTSRIRREADRFNTSGGLNVTSITFHQISIQNNIDASWSMVCIFLVVIILLVVSMWFKMFSRMGDTKIYVEYHDGIHLMSVNELVQRKVRYLPIFQAAWLLQEEELRLLRDQQTRVPLASVSEEEGEEVQVRNGENEKYLD